MPENVTNALNAIGAVCEMAGVMRDQLIENGYERDEAVTIAGNWLIQMMLGKGESGHAGE